MHDVNATLVLVIGNTQPGCFFFFRRLGNGASVPHVLLQYWQLASRWSDGMDNRDGAPARELDYCRRRHPGRLGLAILANAVYSIHPSVTLASYDNMTKPPPLRCRDGTPRTPPPPPPTARSHHRQHQSRTGRDRHNRLHLSLGNCLLVCWMMPYWSVVGFL